MDGGGGLEAGTLCWSLDGGIYMCQRCSTEARSCARPGSGLRGRITRRESVVGLPGSTPADDLLCYSELLTCTVLRCFASRSLDVSSRSQGPAQQRYARSAGICCRSDFAHLGGKRYIGAGSLWRYLT